MNWLKNIYKSTLEFLSRETVQLITLLVAIILMVYSVFYLSSIGWLLVISLIGLSIVVNALNSGNISARMSAIGSTFVLYLVLFLITAAGVSIFQRAASTKTTYASVPFTLTDASFSARADMLVTGNTYLGKITVEATPKFAENVKDGCNPTLLVSQINYKGNWSPDYRAVLTCDEGKEFRLSSQFIK